MTKRYLLSGILVLTLAACANPLDVSNLNDPDRSRTFSNPQDLQVFVAGLYSVAHGATLGAQNDALQPQMAVMSMENVSGLANFVPLFRGQFKHFRLQANHTSHARHRIDNVVASVEACR